MRALDAKSIPTAKAIVSAYLRKTVACRAILLVSLGFPHLCYPLWGDIFLHMTKQTHHATHPDIIKRLKRANGHLLSVVNMIEAGQPCVNIAQQLYAVEMAILQAKRTLIQNHLDQCLDKALAEVGAVNSPVSAEFKTITKYL